MGKPIVRYLTFVAVISIIATLIFDSVDFFDNPVNGLKGYLEIGAFCCVVCVANFFLIAAMASYKWLFASLFPIFSFIGAALAYFRMSSSAVITPMLIDVVLNHDTHEGLELITWSLILFVGVAVLFSAFAVWYRFHHINIDYSWAYFLAGVILMLCYLNCYSRVSIGCRNRYPYSACVAVSEYVKEYKFHDARVSPFTPSDKVERTDSLTIVLVLGEALRADHLSINGYVRNTTPRLSAEENLISFSDIYSEYTHTNRSLPHILTRADSVTEELAFSETSFIPAFSDNGFKTIWISNQELANTYVDFIQECDTSIYAHPEKSPYVYSDFYDLDMLPYISERLAEQNPRDLIILHTIGSHWYYNLHCPDSLVIFKPLTDNRNVKFNTLEQVVNSYDNTILATDCFLFKVIDELRDINSVLIFLSDHGEALGEEGFYLHANDAESVRHPACFIWMSEIYKSKQPEKFAKASENAGKHYRTDFLFPSILDIADIKDSAIDSTLSVVR